MAQRLKVFLVTRVLQWEERNHRHTVGYFPIFLALKLHRTTLRVHAASDAERLVPTQQTLLLGTTEGVK